MVARREADEVPPEFARALASIRAAAPRPEVVLEETPAPQRLAPHAVALSADVVSPLDPDAEIGTGRLVLLPGVGWAWLTEALDGHGAAFAAASGTVTRVASESFGAISGEPASAQIEIRASWTPLDDAFDAHLLAWCDLLCTTAGLPPVAPGVVTLPTRRRAARR
jgi:hypothetical protein